MIPFHFTFHTVNTYNSASGIFSGLGTYPTAGSVRELMAPEIAPNQQGQELMDNCSNFLDFGYNDSEVPLLWFPVLPSGKKL